MKRKLLFFLTALLLFVTGNAWGGTIATMGDVDEGWGENKQSYTLSANKTLKLTFNISATAGGDFDGHYVNITQSGDKMGIQPGGGFYYYGDPWGDYSHISSNASSMDDYKTVLPGSSVTITIRRFGTQIDYFVDIRKESTRLYRRLVTKASTFTENDDITVTLGADHAVLTEITDNVIDESTKGILLGQEDNSGGFGVGVRKDYIIAPNGSLTLHFRNYTNKINKYNNWAFEMQFGTIYADIVSGGGNWGGLLTGANLSFNGSTWPTGGDNDFMDAYNGADVVLTITREGAKVSANAVHKATDGETWTVKYEFTPTTDDFATSDVTFRLLTEGGHMDLLPTSSLSVPSTFALNTSSAENPFTDGSFVAGTYVTALNVDNTTANAWFDSDASTLGYQPYTLSENESVTVSFTAYHGWRSGGANQGVKIINSEGYTLAEYTYNLNSCEITDVKIGGSTPSEFTAQYDCQSKSSGANNASGFVGNGKPYLATAGYNPIFTITLDYDGTVTLNVVLEQKGINNTYTGNVPNGWDIDLRNIQVYSGSNNSDRTIGISNLNVISIIPTAPTASISAPSTMIKKDESLTLTATLTGTPDPAIQWYSNTSNSTEGGVIISGATNATYSPSTSSNGITYYYAVATNSVGNAVSNVLPVVVSDYQTLFTVDGTKSISVPAQTVEDVDLSEYVTISGGAIYARNYHNSSAQSMITKNGEVTSFCLNTNAAFFKVVLDKPLQAGDIISAEVGKTSGYGIRIYNTFNPGTALPSTTDYVSLVATESGLNIKTYTIKNSDTYLIGQNTIYIYRHTANGTYFDNFTVSSPNVVSGKIGSTGWSTFASSEKLDLSSISGGSASAYYASSVDGGNVTLKKTEAIVPSGEGLMIMGTPGETYTIEKSSSDPTFSGNNMLVGCTTSTVLTKNANHYLLYNNGGNAEFRPLTGDYSVTVPAGKAYLNAAASSGARLTIALDEEADPTAITAIEAAETEDGALKDGKYLIGNKIVLVKNGVKYSANGQKLN